MSREQKIHVHDIFTYVPLVSFFLGILFAAKSLKDLTHVLGFISILHVKFNGEFDFLNLNLIC